MSRLLLVAVFALLAACVPDGQPGEACTSSGDGFTKTDSCDDMCVNWEVTCPNGSTLVPDVCAGPVCGAGGSCVDGFMCLQVDSFAANSRCMPAEMCGMATRFESGGSLEDFGEGPPARPYGATEGWPGRGAEALSTAAP